MKKQHLQSLRLNKVSISKFEIRGGLAAPRRGESEFNTVCPMCETEDCPTKNEDR